MNHNRPTVRSNGTHAGSHRTHISIARRLQPNGLILVVDYDEHLNPGDTISGTN